MKKLFRKAITVLGSAGLIGMTVGMAAAASYPDPFTSNTAIVVGANAAPSDNIAAASVASNLDANAASGGSVAVDGGVKYDILKSSDNLNLGDTITSVLPSGKLDKDDFEVALADGIYEDSEDEEYDYNQKLYLATKTVELIVDNDYADKEPTLGYKYDDDANIMTYNITFEDTLNVSFMPTTDLTIAGKDYYVLTASNTGTYKIELLDTTATATLTEGSSTSVIVDGVSYDVSAVFYSDGAIFTVNGEESKQLETGGYDKMAGGVYLVAKSVRYATKESGISTAEFSIGQGKITLENGKEVKVNADSIDKLTSLVTYDSGITGIDIIWNADDELFLTGETGHTSATMPVFDTFSLAFDGIDFPSATADVELSSSEDYISLDADILKGSLSLPILYRAASSDSYFIGLGEDSDSLLTTNASASDGQVFNLTLVEDQNTQFVVTYIKGDDAYTYAYEISGVSEDSNDKSVLDLSGLTGETDITLTDLTDSIDIGDITLTFAANASTENATLTVSTPVTNGKVYADRIVTDAGLRVMLPVFNYLDIANDTVNITDTAARVAVDEDATIDVVRYNDSTTKLFTTIGADTQWTMNFSEEDKDGDIAIGDSFQAVLKIDGTDGIHAFSTTVTTRETLDKDFYIGYVMSALATKVEMDKSGDTNTFVVKYNGEEVTVDVSAIAGGVISYSDAGVMTVMDSAVSSVAGKNLVVVGGSAINSVAAELLGGAYSEALFTSATGVGAGEFLIQSFDRAGKTALLVAGYNAADTEKAVTYLLNNDVDTDTGMKMKGTSATEATVVTEAA